MFVGAFCVLVHLSVSSHKKDQNHQQSLLTSTFNKKRSWLKAAERHLYSERLARRAHVASLSTGVMNEAPLCADTCCRGKLRPLSSLSICGV